MINFNKKDSVADAVKVLIQQEEQKNMDIQYGKDEAEETPARKSIKAHVSAPVPPITQPKVGVVAKEEVEQIAELKKSTVKSYLLKKHDKMYDNPAKNPKQARKDLDNLGNAHARLVGAKPTSEEFVDEGVVDTIKSGAKKVLAKVGGGSDEDQLKRLQKNMGVPQTGKKPVQKEETETVDEALKGNQTKIDKNHNGKIDAQDFKILRGKKTLKNFKEQYSENSIYDDLINEVLSKDASAGAWIHDFVHSDNPKFAGKSKEQRKKQALAAYYAKQRNEEIEELDEKLDQKKKTMDTLTGRVKVPAGTHNQHSDTKVELNSEEIESVEEGWDDMVKDAKDKFKSGPKPSGGSGVKKGTRYGGSKQKDEPEQDEGKKKVTESKDPGMDAGVGSQPDFAVDSGKTTPITVAKKLASTAMKRVRKDLGK